jgi:hypothetical protein
MYDHYGKKNRIESLNRTRGEKETSLDKKNLKGGGSSME